jgi:hypothetical protein
VYHWRRTSPPERQSYEKLHQQYFFRAGACQEPEFRVDGEGFPGLNREKGSCGQSELGIGILEFLRESSHLVVVLDTGGYVGEEENTESIRSVANSRRKAVASLVKLTVPGVDAETEPN